MQNIKSDLLVLKLDIIKKICKLYNIKYTKLKKNEMIELIIKYLSCIKIQRNFRKYISSDQICPISMSMVRYPCFGYKSKNNKKFIYYNLVDIIEYLLNTGDFRDPKTREEYSVEQLKVMDNLKEYYKIPGRSLVFASKDKKFYENKKNNENTILVAERCVDDIISSLRMMIENSEKRVNYKYLLKYLFESFGMYFKHIIMIDLKLAEGLINQYINTINETHTRAEKNLINDFKEKGYIQTSELKSEEELRMFPNLYRLRMYEQVDLNSDYFNTYNTTNINKELDKISLIRDSIIQFLYQIYFDDIEFMLNIKAQQEERKQEQKRIKEEQKNTRKEQLKNKRIQERQERKRLQSQDQIQEEQGIIQEQGIIHQDIQIQEEQQV